MATFNESNYRKIATYYKTLGEKKLFKSSLKSLSLNKRVFLFYFKYKNIPICALPRLRSILASRHSFLSFCYNFFNFVNSNGVCVEISPDSLSLIAKFIVSHEVGHIVDKNIYRSKEQYTAIIYSIIDKIIKYNIDVSNNNIHKENIPDDLEKSLIALKKNLIDREVTAWNNAKSMVNLKDSHEEFIFNKVKEYALATYNFGNLKSVVKEHNIDTILKYTKKVA